MSTDTPTADLLERVRHDLCECAGMSISLDLDHMETLELLRECEAEITRLRAELEQARAALKSAQGYLRNAKIDLETGCPKRTAIQTLDGGLRLVDSALSSSHRESAPEPAVPDGWKLVPVEPTVPMIAAGVAARDTPGSVGKASDIYRAMLSASPSPEDAHDNNA